MSAGHVCDGCMTVAPVDEAFGWWAVVAVDTSAGVLLEVAQKSEYHFCSWRCIAEFFSQEARSAVEGDS